MFMLFYSILYGIMLNSLIGLGAFPLARALAGKDLMNVEEPLVKGSRSRRRCFLSFFLFDIFPFVYFALGYQFPGQYMKSFPSDNPVLATLQIVSIGTLSLGVFSFYRLFLAAMVWKPCGSSLIYTVPELENHKRKRGLHEKASLHAFAALGYLAVPWLIVIVTVLASR